MHASPAYRIALLALLLGLKFAAPARAQAPSAGVVLSKHVPIYTTALPGTPLYRAVLALERDLNNVLGGDAHIRPSSASGDGPGIVIRTAGDAGVVPTVSGTEAHRVNVGAVNGTPQVILEGADLRGTIYAIYTFSERVLGVPPFWYFTAWKPEQREAITVDPTLDIRIKSPQVQYRAWFPNDTDLFAPWRRRSSQNNEMWLEAALRLKLNTIEWFDDQRDYTQPYSLSPTTKLIADFGLLNTTHHHSPLNASFHGWNDYWTHVRHVDPPARSLANEQALIEFWRYNIESVVRNKIEMIWVLGFRGMGDHPFWETFKDAPASMADRGAVISRMLKIQRDLVLEVTHDPKAQFRSIFYNEISDLLAAGHIQLPDDPAFIRTYVASRRDHFPNQDVRQLPDGSDLRLGYYFNYQFTSTGSHLAPAEGPWKMEWNYRCVAGKSRHPLAMSVVNAGNIREYVMELSANAAMMWDFDVYRSDAFVRSFCAQYFGSDHADQAAALYRRYYDAFWRQKRPDLDGLDRQYVFQDLRYQRAIRALCSAFNQPFDPNPLKDIGGETEPGRTYRIVPADNGAANQIDAILAGTTQAELDFAGVAEDCDALAGSLADERRTFFNDSLRQPAYYMLHLNTCLRELATAYRSTDAAQRLAGLKRSLDALHQAQQALLSTQHEPFEHWYDGDRVFDFKATGAAIQSLIDRH